jgi:hypothetical protein
MQNLVATSIGLWSTTASLFQLAVVETLQAGAGKPVQQGKEPGGDSCQYKKIRQ